MITKVYEMVCNHCGGVEHFTDTQQEAERQARLNGWIITRDKKHFDFERCRKAYLNV